MAAAVIPTCTACGTATEPDARFCGVCGTRLDLTSVAARSVPLGATVPDLRRGPDPRPGHALVAPAPLDGTVPLQRPGHAPLDGTVPLQRPDFSPPAGFSAGPGAPHPAPHPVPPAQQAQQPQGRSLSPPGVAASQPGAARSISPRGAPAASGARRLDMRPIPPSLDRLMGRTLNGRYLVERKIGEGGFGAVFRGRQVATGREVALKILHPHNLGDATVVARFRREAEACSKLTNPHTVTIYDFDETEDGTLYLAMELLRGRALQDVERAEGPLDPRRVLTILAQVAEALGEAHALGIVHRDMKPENIMIEVREGLDYVKVLDFGIAKLGDTGAGKPVPALTAVGQTLGTLEFMSPEQLRGRPLDGRSDIYALGIVAYEMLTGLLPWREARVPIDVIKFHLETTPPAPSHLRRDLAIPREVDEIVLRMCAKDPADRYVDAADLRGHLEETIGALDRRNGRGRTVRVLGVAAGIVLLLAAAGLVLFR